MFIILLFFLLLNNTTFTKNNDYLIEFGPIITFKNDKANNLEFKFYSSKNKKYKIQFIGKSYQEKFVEENKKKWHKFNINIKNLKQEIYYNFETENYSFSSRIKLPSYQNFKVGIIGDTKGSYDIFSNICHQISKNHDISLLVHLGDFIDNPVDKKEWTKFYSYGKELLSKTIIIPVIGNHDYYSQLWQDIFKVPDNNHSFYDYEIYGIHFIILNSDMYFGQDSIQYAWLKKQLNKNLPKIILLHHPFFTSLASRKDDIKIIALQNIILPLLTNSNVKLVISGHDHLYERSEYNNICFITAGGCAKNLDNDIIENIYRKKIITNLNHYIILNINKKIEINVYSINNILIDNINIIF